MKTIDFHCHFDPQWYAGRSSFDEAEYMRGLDRCDVDVACVFTINGLFGDCARHNDLMVERVARHAQRLIPFATVDPKHGDAAVTELERCLASGVFKGVKFHP